MLVSANKINANLIVSTGICLFSLCQMVCVCYMVFSDFDVPYTFAILDDGKSVADCLTFVGIYYRIIAAQPFF